MCAAVAGLWSPPGSVFSASVLVAGAGVGRVVWQGVGVFVDDFSRHRGWVRLARHHHCRHGHGLQQVYVPRAITGPNVATDSEWAALTAAVGAYNDAALAVVAGTAVPVADDDWRLMRRNPVAS
jgi:hypothetical protein